MMFFYVLPSFCSLLLCLSIDYCAYSDVVESDVEQARYVGF